MYTSGLVLTLCDDPVLANGSLREIAAAGPFDLIVATNVLVYYGVANASAATLDRRAPLPWLGLAGCLLVAASLPLPSVLGGLAVFAVGAVWYALTERRARTN